MPYAVIYALIGYLSGSVLYAEVFCGIFGRKNAIEQEQGCQSGNGKRIFIRRVLVRNLHIDF